MIRPPLYRGQFALGKHSVRFLTEIGSGREEADALIDAVVTVDGGQRN